MPEPYDIKLGDCVDSIAFSKQLRTDAIWDDDANKVLRALRKDRNVLFPGDVLTLPDKEIKWEAAKHTGLTHVFKRKLPTKEFRFQAVLGTPIKGYACTVTIDAVVVPSKVDGDWIVCQIPPNAKEAVITIDWNFGKSGADPILKQKIFTVKLGHLRPVDTPEGQEDRFRNLGLFSKLADKTEPTLKQVIALFQASHGIEPADGVINPSTITKLKELTGDPL